MQFTNLTSIDGDAAGNIYLGGGKLNTGTGMDIFVMKLDDDLNVLWTQSYNSDESNYDVANAIHVDKNGNVVVGGKSEIEGEESNYTVIKYNSSGTQQWVASFNGTKNGTDEVTALNSDNSGNIYVTGTSFNGMNKDFHTIKYNTSGTKQWEISHNSIKNADDIPYGIAKVGDMVLVCGHTGDGNPSNYKLVQYQELEMIVPPDDELISSAYSYQANNGQIVDNNGDLVPEIKYESTNGFPKAYFSDDKVHFVLAKIDTIPTTEDTLYRMDMSFNNNNSPQVYASKRNESYANYFLGGLAEPVTAVPNYKQLIMNDVWSGIDIVYSSNNKGFKMYIICEAGVDPATVSLKFEGAQNLSSSGNNILLETAIGNIDFSRVTAYQIYSNERTPFETEPSIVIDGEDLSFHFENGYDYLAPVVIQVDFGHLTPSTAQIGNIEWSSFLGGNKRDYIRKVKTDLSTNAFYVFGDTFSEFFPNNTGIVNERYKAGRDMFLCRFKPDKNIDWTTYYGGNMQDISDGFIENGTKLIATGRSNSINLPTPNGYGSNSYHKTTLSGLDLYTDGVIFVLNKTDGVLLHGTYFGGYFNEGIHGVEQFSSNASSFYIYGETNSMTTTTNNTTSPCPTANDNGFPLCNNGGYFQSSHGGGNTDAFVAQFSTSNFQLLWSTYFGGSGYDNFLNSTAYSTDIDGKLFFVGATSSSNPSSSSSYCSVPVNGEFPLCNSNSQSYFQTSFQGSGNGIVDGIIVQFNRSNELKWSTYFGGYSSDWIYAVDIDNNAELHIGGNTLTSTASNINCDVPTNGGFPVCSTGNKYFASNASPGHGDAFISTFNSNNQLTWSTFLGGDLGERINVIKILDKNTGNFMIGGETNSTNFPVSNSTGSYYQYQLADVSNNSGLTDGFIGYFNSNKQKKWTSYYGGISNPDDFFNDFEFVNDIDVLNNERIIVVGKSDGEGLSANFPLTCDLSQNYCDLIGEMNNNIVADGFMSIINLNDIIISNVQETNESNSTLIYPNPSSHNITIENTFETIKEISVYNLVGVLMIKMSHIKEGKTTLDISSFSNGMYYLQVSDYSGKITSAKFIKQ